MRSLFLFFYIFLWIPAWPELVFIFLKNEFSLSVFPVSFFKKSIDFGTRRHNNTVEKQLKAHRVDFAAFSRTIGNWWEKLCFSHVVKYTIRWESDGRKVSIRQTKMSTNFLDSLNSMDFAAFSHVMGNWWGNPCISHIIKYIIECESNWKKKHPYYGKSISTNSQGSPHTMGFVGFPRKSFFQAFPIRWVFLLFPIPWEIGKKLHAFPTWWSIRQNGNLMEKSTHFMEKVWDPISQACPIRWVSLYYGELDEKTHSFRIWWSTP